jgi:hypothetical protein
MSPDFLRMGTRSPASEQFFSIHGLFFGLLCRIAGSSDSLCLFRRFRNIFV